MKTIHLIRLLSVISLVLLAVIFLPQFLTEIQLPGVSSQTNQLVSVDPNSITAVSLIGPSNEIQNLSKNGENWQINGVDADSNMVQKLLSALTDARINSIAATNELNFDKLGVSSGSAQLVVITSGTTDKTIAVGKPGSTLNTFYAKDADKSDVFLVKGSLLNVLSQPIERYIASGSAAASAAATLTPAQ